MAQNPEFTPARAYLEQIRKEIECALPPYVMDSIPTPFTGRTLEEFELSRCIKGLTKPGFRPSVIPNALVFTLSLPIVVPFGFSFSDILYGVHLPNARFRETSAEASRSYDFPFFRMYNFRGFSPQTSISVFPLIQLMSN